LVHVRANSFMSFRVFALTSENSGKLFLTLSLTNQAIKKLVIPNDNHYHLNKAII
jgi:hypothetical protein